MAARDPSEELAQTIAVAMFLVEEGLQKIRGKITRRALRLINEKLGQIETQLMTMKPDSWSATRAKAVQAVLRRGLAELTADSVRQTAREMATVSLEARNQMTRYLTTLDKAFTGAVQPISFDSLSWWEQTAAGINRTRVRYYTNSWQRYGASTTIGIENAIAKRVLVGERWDLARDEVWSAVREQVGNRQWMVDRILRTETSAAWNGTALEAMREEDRTSREDDLEYDPMFKKLVSTFDDVTGRDSVVLHGQTRPVDQPFYDSVNGITYMAPPNRPLDREVVVPWRQSYGEEFEDYTVETADGYDPDIHGERARLQARRPISNDPTKPSVRERRDQLRNLRAQRAKAVDELREARLAVTELEQKDPRAYREELIHLTNRRQFLTTKVSEMTSWIDQIEAM